MKKYLILMFALLISTGFVYAAGNMQTDIFFDEATGNPVTGVQEILYTCSSSECLSQGSLVHNLNTGASNQLTFTYPYNPSSTESNPDYFSHFSFKQCYLPKEYIEWSWSSGVSVEYDYNMRKAQGCHSPITSFSVTNTNMVNEPIIIDMDTSLEADAYSAFTDMQLAWFPAGYEDYYSVETRVTLEILNEDDVVVHSTFEDLDLLMDTSENVQFNWIPTEEGVYTARVTTSITDCQCDSSSAIEDFSEKQFSVWAEQPRDECYTLINDLDMNPIPAVEGVSLTISYNKTSNYADNSFIKTPVQTSVVYEIQNQLGASVFSDSIVLNANPSSILPQLFSFDWTPTISGNYNIRVTGIAQDSLCVGKTNPEDIAIMGIFVNENPIFVCGNNVLETGEECDDGNLVDGDGCSSVCATEVASVCGNNILETGEGCDDGNLVNGDGCSRMCRDEEDEGGRRSSSLSDNDCNSRWVCSPWGDCEGGFKTRTCTDSEKCGTDYGKPDETLRCSSGVLNSIEDSMISLGDISESSWFSMATFLWILIILTIILFIGIVVAVLR